MTRKARIGLLLVLAMAVVLTVCVASALAVGVTLEVGAGHYATIQAAVDAASTGDTILVEAGTYAEQVVISGKTDLTIQGVGDGTLIEPAYVINTAAITIKNSDGLTIRHLKIHTAGEEQQGIWVKGALYDNDLSVTGLTIQNTTIIADGGSGAAPASGIIADASTDAAHSGWLITGNRITASACAIVLQDVTDSRITGNTLTVPHLTGGTNTLWTSERFNLTGLVFSDNVVSGSSGSQVTVITDYNQLGSNVAAEAPPVETTIAGVTFHGNTFSNWGSRAIRVGDAEGTVPGTVTGIGIDFNTFQMTTDTAVIGGTDAPSATGGLNIFNVTAPARIQTAMEAAFPGDTINGVSISFASNGGSTVADIMQDFGTAVTAPTAPTRTGYTFAGWYSDAGLLTPFTFPTTMPASDTTAYAKWTANTYTITFASNGGTGVTAITQAFGSAVTAPTAPTKTGSTFGGWYSDAGLLTPFTFPTTMPASSITLYAKWTVTPVLMPVWRFYNMRTGAHFYTASATEMANVRDTLYRTYRLEGVAYYVNTANPANNIPLYRFYNFKKGVHFYTASESEKDNVVRTLSSTYRLEGVAYYVSLASSGGAAPVYRFYNFKKGVHFYTASESEKDNVLRTLWSTYRLEGVGFYLAP